MGCLGHASMPPNSLAMLRDPEKTLPNSYFLPNTHNGPVTLRFPYAIGLARIVLMPRFRNILARRAEWSSLYAADDASGALRLMAAICEAFVELAKARGQRALIVMLPTAAGFRQQTHYGKFEYAPLVAELEARGVEIFDPGPAMIDVLAGRSACEFFIDKVENMPWLSSPVPCTGHYSRIRQYDDGSSGCL